MNELLDYIIVGFIIFASIVYLLFSFKRKKQGKSSCTSCSEKRNFNDES